MLHALVQRQLCTPQVLRTGRGEKINLRARPSNNTSQPPQNLCTATIKKKTSHDGKAQVHVRHHTRTPGGGGGKLAHLMPPLQHTR